MISRSIHWAHKNLFASVGSGVLSVLLITGTVYVLSAFLGWALLRANWMVVSRNMEILLVGTYPQGELWRALFAGILLGALLGLTLGAVEHAKPNPKRAMIAGVIACLLAIGMDLLHQSMLGGLVWSLFGLFIARAAALRYPRLCPLTAPVWGLGVIAVYAILLPAGVHNLGGLLFSVLFTATAALLSLPLGTLIALGRNSRFASVRLICLGYVELIRGVPLITILYWAWIVIPLFLPAHVDMPSMFRGIIGFTLFYTAFTAEYIRSGIQGVSKGQSEAAQSIGLGKLDENVIIILPQAIRSVVPALVGNVLDLFNNVPTLFIIGVADLLASGRTILENPAYSGELYEVYCFLFAAYLVLGAVMSFISRKIERNIAKGQR